MLGYRVPRPDEAMLVAGGKYGMNGAPFKVVTGHGSFVLPFVRRANFLTLSMCAAEVTETCVTKPGIAPNARAAIASKGRNDQESRPTAAPRVLSHPAQLA